MMYDATRWRVCGRQLDLLSDSPALILAHKITGELKILHPVLLRDGVEESQIYDAGYLHGYSDARAGKPLCPTLPGCS